MTALKQTSQIGVCIQERELEEVRARAEELRVRAEERKSETEEERAKAERLQTLSVALQAELDQQKQQSRHSLSQLQQDITRLTQQLDTERVSGAGLSRRGDGFQACRFICDHLL